MRDSVLIVGAGALFGLMCVLIVAVEYIIKLIAIPVMLCFGIGVLARDQLYQRFRG
jgi:hypothetical protein